jgi:xylulokinase
MLVGIDIGTQSLKAVVVDDELAPRGEAAVGYPVEYPRPGWAEQDPRRWTEALAPAIGRALAAAGARPAEVRGLGVAGQLDGCVPCDAAGAALGPCLLWMDRRAVAELPPLDPAAFVRLTGQVLDAGHLAAKARWLDRHRPGAARFQPPVGFLVEALTGEAVIDHALASTTNLYDLGAAGWSPALLAAFELAAARLPRVAAATDLAGRLHAGGAALTGLPAGLPVAVGTGDDFATPLGAGLVAPGPVACVLGTAEVVGALADRPVIDADRLVETHAYPAGGWLVENPGWLAGGALAWLGALARFPDAAALDAAAAATPPGADGVTFLPALSGAMAPEWNAAARGAWTGLTAGHGAGHLARAVLEACAHAMRDVVDRLGGLGVAATSLLLLGGGARSALWAQIRADVSGLPVARAAHADPCPIGAALLAAVAVGAAPDLAAAAARIPAAVPVAEPRPAHREAAEAAYRRYRQVYAALRPTFGA